MDIVVFGAGSLGSLVGGMLAREHRVTLVGRDPHVAAVRASGLDVVDETGDTSNADDGDGAGDSSESADDAGEFGFSVAPDATTDGTDLAADLAVVTVKAFDTKSAASDLGTGRFDAVLSLQNGMSNEATLADHLDCPVLAGTASYGAMLTEPGRVACTGVGRVVFGPRAGGRSSLADRVGEVFAESGVETAVVADAPRRLWEKLAVNAGINATTALARTDNGALLSGGGKEVAADAARETAGVARAEGVELTDDEAVAGVERVAAATAANASSMRQDVEAGRRTEIDAINGYVVARAREHGLSVPVNRTLTALIQTWEHGRDAGE